MKARKIIAAALAAVLAVSQNPWVQADEDAEEVGSVLTEKDTEVMEEVDSTDASDSLNAAETTDSSDSREEIETALNLANNEDQEWTYSETADAWTLSIVSAVAYPELPDQQGVSVCVPGAYVTGIDTNGDGTADVTAQDGETAVKGSLVIDYEAQITSENGQTYTAAAAPVILNTGAAGYGSQTNSLASSEYAASGYINVSCGNRGKQDTVENEDGETVYTGDAPSCLADQKAAARFVKYNILLGNLPGSVDYFVSTGGSGGGAHAVMFAATSNNEDYYDYEIEAGAVGVYKNSDGTYSTTVTIDGTDYEISDGAWGCVAYSAITSLAEADMALAFEYYLDTDYEFNTAFQKKLAEYLSQEYMEYINGQNLSVKESDVGFDLNDDGDQDDTVALTIEYDLEAYPETNGYYGTYLNLYLAEFTANLQWFLDNLDYAEDWTWFDESGNALSDEEVASMTTEEKAQAFLEGRYAKGTTEDDLPDGLGGGGLPDGEKPDGLPGKGNDGEAPDDLPGGGNDVEKPDDLPGKGNDGEAPDDLPGGGNDGEKPDDLPEDGDSKDMIVGTPDSGTTQSSSSAVDSANYSTYEEMLESYKEDITEIESGDEYGKNIVSLYNPLEYIGADGTENPTWTRIVMGASEGDMSMFSSLNLQIAWLNAGVDAQIEWQWDGEHVPSEIFGNSLFLTVDTMYGKYVEGAAEITKAAATAQTENGSAEEATGTDISSWVNADDIQAVSFTLSDAVSYRAAGASKATPGFDVMDYGQEDYVFGSVSKDARHFDAYLLRVLEEHAEELSGLFNQG